MLSSSRAFQRPECPGTTAGCSIASPLRAAFMILVCALSSKVCSSSVPSSLHCSRGMTSPTLAGILLAESKDPKQSDIQVATPEVARCPCAGMPAQMQPLHFFRHQAKASNSGYNG